MSTIQEAITSWESLWQQGCSVFGQFVPGPEREALELILAAMLYQRWALAGFDEHSFHLAIRENLAGTMADVAAGSLDCLSDRHHVGAGMHLASASVRLPFAIHQIAKIRQNGADFEGLYDAKEEWPRPRACRYLDEIQQLTHCSSHLTRPLSLTLSLLMRDEFVHGEVGSRKGHWFRERQITMAGLHRCQVTEAQQILARWAFDSMT